MPPRWDAVIEDRDGMRAERKRSRAHLSVVPSDPPEIIPPGTRVLIHDGDEILVSGHLHSIGHVHSRLVDKGIMWYNVTALGGDGYTDLFRVMVSAVTAINPARSPRTAYCTVCCADIPWKDEGGSADA